MMQQRVEVANREDRGKLERVNKGRRGKEDLKIGKRELDGQ